MKRYSN